MLKQDFREELKQSMLSKDELRTSVLRMVLSAIGYYEIKTGGAGYEATGDDVLAVIQKEVKQHKDSIEQFTKAGRLDLTGKETIELDLLQKYLPKQLSEEEIKKLVQHAIHQTGSSSARDMGKVMGLLMPKIRGKADGTMVSKIVKDSLTS